MAILGQAANLKMGQNYTYIYLCEVQLDICLQKITPNFPAIIHRDFTAIIFPSEILARVELSIANIYFLNISNFTVMTSCFTDGDIELQNFVYEGQTREIAYSFTARVDYCYNGTLQGICDVGWSDNDAAVACRRNGDRLRKAPHRIR